MYQPTLKTGKESAAWVHWKYLLTSIGASLARGRYGCSPPVSWRSPWFDLTVDRRTRTCQIRRRIRTQGFRWGELPLEPQPKLPTDKWWSVLPWCRSMWWLAAAAAAAADTWWVWPAVVTKLIIDPSGCCCWRMCWGWRLCTCCLLKCSRWLLSSRPKLFQGGWEQASSVDQLLVIFSWTYSCQEMVLGGYFGPLKSLKRSPKLILFKLLEFRLQKVTLVFSCIQVCPTLKLVY